MTKLTKEETNYSRGMIHSHCGKVFPNDNGYCKHFIRHHEATSNGECQIVDGPIDPVYWCTEFAKARK